MTIYRDQRAQAMRDGKTRFYTGQPCKHGHVCERVTSSRQCVECNAISSRKKYAKHRVAIRQAAKARPLSMTPASIASRAEGKRRWREKNKDRHNEIARAADKKNPIGRRARVAKRRALVRSAEGAYSKADVTAKLEAQSGRCVYCSTDLLLDGFHIDHMVPLSRGGSNWPTNIQLLCETCNLRKNNKTPEEFIQVLARLASLTELRSNSTEKRN